MGTITPAIPAGRPGGAVPEESADFMVYGGMEPGGNSGYRSFGPSFCNAPMLMEYSEASLVDERNPWYHQDRVHT